MKRASIFFLILTIALRIYSIPATPDPVTIKQSDGSTITVRMHGDEFFNYKTTLDGYLLTSDKSEILNYAILKEGKITNSFIKASEVEKRTVAEKNLIRSLVPYPDLSAFRIKTKMMRAKSSGISTHPQKAFPITGTPKSIVILVNFSDLKFTIANPQTAYTNLLNQNGYSSNGASGSARDYFHDASNGNFNPQFDVFGPVTLDKSMANYGVNNINGVDSVPYQIVIDACTKAAAMGLDFSQYDTDKDGVIDNVFIYYAGYNEAEGGPKNTIWPHRWGVYPSSLFPPGVYNYTGSSASITFNGCRLEVYACTSELRVIRDETNSNMCGIGAFCHEFGHVLGLDDYYDTSSTNPDHHHTLSKWNIMDSGSYLNLSRTPPTYCGYDRYFLNWLMPDQLVTRGDYNLVNLGTNNKALLISQTANRCEGLANDIKSPEYFILENRQQTGWDKYLPGHGMIVYHIYYNPTTWNDNGPNNDVNAMGVDIVEADGITAKTTISPDPTLSGDPFPGVSNVATFNPIMRNGSNFNKPIINIKENNGIIQFKYNPNIDVKQTIDTFNTFPATPVYQTVVVSGNRIKGFISISLKSGKQFKIKTDYAPETAWKNTFQLSPIDSIVAPTTIQIRYNPTALSLNTPHIDTLRVSTTSNDYIDVCITGISKRPVYIVPPVATDATDPSFSGFVANWNAVSDSIGKSAKYYLTVYNLINGQENYVLQNKFITTNIDTVTNLLPGSEYFYKVRASDKTINYENITDFSNIISVSTTAYPFKTKLVTKVESNGDLTVYLPTVQNILYVYNLLGQTVKTIIPGGTVIKITDLPKNQVYILKAGDLITKIAY